MPNSSRASYEAVDFIKAEPAKFAEMVAPEFGLTPAKLPVLHRKQPFYTDLAESRPIWGRRQARNTRRDL